MVRVGKLKHRINIQFPLLESDGMGGLKETWPVLETEAEYNVRTWAEIRPAASDKISQAAHTFIEDTFDFTIRKRNGLDLTKTWRIVYDGGAYMPNGITELNLENRFIIIRAKRLK